MRAVLALLIAHPAFAGQVECASMSASSSFPKEGLASYEPKMAFDRSLATSWQEGQPGSSGADITCDFGGSKQIHGVKLWGGLWATHEFWQGGNRPHQVELKFSDGSTELHDMPDEMVPHDIKFASPKNTSSVRVRIKSVYSGNAWTDSGFSEIMVYDASPDPWAPMAGVTASSTLPADNDGSYDAVNAIDGMADSAWCEGNKTGDGVGEWLKIDLKGSHSVSKLTIIAGIGTYSGFLQANRAKALTLEFSDGSKESLTLEPKVKPVTVSFPAHTTSSVKIVVGGVVTGKFNDLCISEAYFSK